MATYSSYKELVGTVLALKDDIKFKVKEEIYLYTVYSNHLSCKNKAENDSIFTALNISDKSAFAAHVYGYTICGGTEPICWPEYNPNDYIAATNIVLTLFKLCEDYNKKDTKKEPVLSERKSLYKVGDRVIVKDKLDEGCDSGSYPYNFTSDMYSTFGGLPLEISKVIYSTSDHTKKMFVEPFYYTLKQGERALPFIWHASMFRGKLPNSNPKKGFSCDGFSFTRKDVPESCPYHPYVIDQAITEFSKGINPVIKSPKDALKKCISDGVSTWFEWKESSQGEDYWMNIYNKPSFVPENYVPAFFLEDIIEKVPEEPQEHYKDLPKESPEITSCKSLKIPCSYEEVVISFKKKPIHF